MVHFWLLVVGFGGELGGEELTAYTTPLRVEGAAFTLNHARPFSRVWPGPAGDCPLGKPG